MDLSESTSTPGARHPWEIARARFFVARLLEIVQPAGRVLDAGCGDAFVAVQVAEAMPSVSVSAIDTRLDDSRLGHLQEGHPGIRFSNAWSDLGGELFDVLLMLDVLEHIESDRDFLVRVCGTFLKTGGYAMVAGPAFPFLFARHDERLGHFRRYRFTDLHRLVSSLEGCRVVTGGYLFFSLLLPRLLQVAAGGRFRLGTWGYDVARWRGGPRSTRLLTSLLEFDNVLMYRFSRMRIYCPGLSVWVLCRKG